MQGFSEYLAAKNISVPQNYVFAAQGTDDESYELKLTPLNPSVAEIDYKTVLLNQIDLVGIFGENHPWPEPTMTFQQNLNSLRVHQLEFESQKAFAYSITNSDASQCFGSVYIDPSSTESYECEVYFWICKTIPVTKAQIQKQLSHWLTHTWKFTRIKIH
ncbi:hypothetical protein A7985_04165 [Pseudoalteromonas luteoviolacea]|uniref:Uncharacterized protein n=1 Tax=Pseudoalteromonas luteoviolacea TaxID=43657 RepID=A0A1C0TV11_9GAMM|nr:hypothetical protein [Pseudoalteromonas luteoviolacea]OCQ23153.1 hypothetical protein A7985_04165 [Pseudoalteromonas luteoviolacea]